MFVYVNRLYIHNCAYNHNHTIRPDPIVTLLLRRIPRPINRLLDRPRYAALTRIELAPDDPVLGEGSADLLANLSDRAFRVELLTDGTTGGDDTRVGRLCVFLFANSRSGVVEWVVGHDGFFI